MKIKGKTQIENILKVVLIILLLSSILVISFIDVRALGVAPSRDVIDYDSIEHTVTFRIINNEHKNTKVRIYAQGELGQYVSAAKTLYTLTSSDEEIPVAYSIKLPDNLSPGSKSAEIVALEVGDDTQSSGQLLLSALGIVHELRVNVPYPGKYAEGILYVSSGNVNDSIQFTASIINRGSESIKDISGELVIKGPTNEEIYRSKTEGISDLGSKNSGKIETAWRANVNPGMYYAEFIINYDGKTIVLRNSFVIGAVDLEISKLSVGPFTLGAVAEFNVEVVNKWNQPLDNVFGELQIMDSQGNILSTIKTNNFEAQPLSTSKITAYWNTKGMDVGNYDVRVLMHYAEKTSEKLFKTIVGINSITIENDQLQGNVVIQEPKGNSNSVLITLVIILIAINVGWFVYFKFLKKKEQ